jgi:hypothetical protein
MERPKRPSSRYALDDLVGNPVLDRDLILDRD